MATASTDFDAFVAYAASYPNATATAGFRQLGSMMCDTLEDAGFTVQESNVDWTTVDLTAGAGIKALRVYKLNDAISPELYVKLEWYSIASTTAVNYGFRVYVTVGTTHSSGGVIGGYSTSASFSLPNNNVAGTVNAAHGTGYALLQIDFDSTAYNPFFLVERSRDTVTGAATGEGYVVVTHGYNVTTSTSSSYGGCIKAYDITRNRYSGSLTTTTAGYPLSNIGPQWVAQFDTFDPTYNNVAFLTPLFFSAGESMGALHGILFGSTTTISEKNQYSVVTGGTTLTYRSFKSTGQGPTGSRLMYLWQ